MSSLVMHVVILTISVLLTSISFASCAIIETRENFLNVNVHIDPRIKKELGYTEDALLNFTGLANKYGYPTEEHYVVTEDGHILKLFRIPRGRLIKDIGPPVLAMHGVTDSADTWIFPGPQYGLGYLISDAGYDLWCANYRGNKYSRNHTTLNPNTDVRYWKFSFDEMAQFDLPAIIDYILELRGLPTLSYVGFSQGTTIFYAMGAYRPDNYDKFDIMISLAPISWLTNIYNPYLRIISKAINELEAIMNTLGVQELFASASVYGQSLEYLCHYGKLSRPLCSTILFSLMGFDEEQLRDEMVALIGSHTPCGTSLQNLVHLGQEIYSTQFKRYDRGARDNLKAYGALKPPEYNVSLVTTPVALFSGENDWLSTPKDVARLRRNLPRVVEHYVVPRRWWQHTDHLWAKEAPTLVGNKIITLLGKYSRGFKNPTVR